MEKAKEKQKERNERGGEKMKNSIKSERQKGITLIALVITIIVLLILAAVSIATLTGENGILTKASGAKVENAHASVKEAMRLEYTEYIFEKNQGQSTGTLIDYLQGKKIIGEAGEDGKYKIDVEKLSNTEIDLGKGTDGKDVYMLEEVAGEETEGAGTGKLGEIASIKAIKIAETTESETEKTYKIMYYGKNASDNVELEILKDNISKKKEMITFDVCHSNYGHSERGDCYFIVRYQCEKNTTWKEFVKSKYNSKEYVELIEEKKEGEFDRFWRPFTIDEDDLIEGPCSGMYFGAEYINPYQEIEASKEYEDLAQAECVYPNSNILVSKDGKTIQAKDIKEGNEIAYYNFETEQVEIGTVEKAYIHKQATNFVRYKFEDGSYLEATDYHPIYTKEGWKSYTRRNGYEKPEVGDEVKTEKGWKKLVSIEGFEGLEDCYDFVVKGKDGKIINNYYANGTLVQGSY